MLRLWLYRRLHIFVLIGSGWVEEVRNFPNRFEIRIVHFIQEFLDSPLEPPLKLFSEFVVDYYFVLSSIEFLDLEQTALEFVGVYVVD